MSSTHEAITSPGPLESVSGFLSRTKAVVLRLDRPAKVSVGVLAFGVFTAIVGPFLAPYDPAVQNYSALLEPPLTPGYVFGTDIYGRDVLSRLIYGSRVSLTVAFGAVTAAVVLGLSFGSMAGYYGGWIDEAIMRFMDILFAFPSLILALALIAVAGSSLENLIIVLAVVFTPTYARLIRGSILSVKEEPFVEAAINTGLSERKVMLRHVIPNAIAPVIVQASFHMAVAMLIEAALSFLGLGVQPPKSSWGIMIANGRTEMPKAWWLMTLPGLAIMIIVLAFNFVGDGLRDELDPHSLTEEKH